jgi:branched-chain amino acid aminotransferase
MDICINDFFIENGAIKKVGLFNEANISSGKSLYEVIRVTEGIPVFLESHLDRLRDSSKIANFSISLKNEKISDHIKKLIEINKVTIGNIKVVFNYSITNLENYFIYFIKHEYPTNDEYQNGVGTTLIHVERENPNAKIINNKFREFVDKIKAEKNVYEGILVDEKGNITEGTKSNIFIVKGKKVYTSPAKNVLMGITRKMIIEICRRKNIIIIEESISYKDLAEIDGLFITGTSPKVLPIANVDKKYYNSSKNEIIKLIETEYNNDIKMYLQIAKEK